MSNFIVQALQGNPITIYGDGSQTRSFCYVDDMVYALIRLMQTPSACTGPMNLGNPEECTILDLAQLIIRLTDSKSKIVKMGLPQDDPERRKPDISFAKSTLAWIPKVPLEEGRRRTIAYFEDLLRSGSVSNQISNLWVVL